MGDRVCLRVGQMGGEMRAQLPSSTIVYIVYLFRTPWTSLNICFVTWKCIETSLISATNTLTENIPLVTHS